MKISLARIVTDNKRKRAFRELAIKSDLSKYIWRVG